MLRNRINFYSAPYAFVWNNIALKTCIKRLTLIYVEKNSGYYVIKSIQRNINPSKSMGRGVF